MKKTTSLLLFFVFNFTFSQATYLSTDFASVGEEILVSNATSGINTIDFEQTGTNFSWNYSQLTPTTQETLLWQNPNNAGYKNIWCLTNGFLFNCNSQFNNVFNLATKLTDGIQIQGFGITNVIDHLKKDANALSNKMVGSSITVNGISLPFVASYQTPDIIYQFPIQFNDNYTNSSALSIDLNNLNVPIQYESAAERTNLVEGWGTLTTPYGTFANVLKMKTTFVNTQTITTTTGSTPTTITTVSYKWFDPAYPIPVLEVVGNEVAGQWIATRATYIDNQVCLAPNAFFVYFPIASDYDPTTQTAEVSFINSSINYDTISWDFGDGSPESTNANPTHTYSCPGLKDVTLTLTNTFCNPVQTDVITLPVNITDTQNSFTNSITISENTLTADRNLSGTSYLWLNCDNNNEPITGATSQSFTPTENGNYAVQLTTNGCESSSDCVSFTVLSNTNFDVNTTVKLYPNPTKGIVHLSDRTLAVQKVHVYNMLGIQVSDKLELSNLAQGVYLVKIITDKGTIMKKVVKE